MKYKKKITIDLRTSTLLGPTCLFFWSLKHYYDSNYKVKLINKHWGQEKFLSGLRYDKGKKEFIKGSSIYLWDPTTHPNDLLYNLIEPTFPNLKIEEKKYSYLKRIFLNIPNFFNRNKIYLNDFATTFLEEKDKNSYNKMKTDYFKKNPSIIELLRLFLHFFYMKFFQKFKEKPLSKPFRYQIHKSLLTRELIEFVNLAKSSKKKHILISVLWDEGKKFENQNDRLRGGPHFIKDDWENMLKYVKQLDDYALRNKNIRFVLASKKAVDWDKYLKSDYIDLRNFEELGFTLSQSIYIAQEICDASINWPSTYSIWITNCANMIHLTWGGNKDTAQWARNKLHKDNPKKLLSLLDC